jgi:hypothetical protein
VNPIRVHSAGAADAAEIARVHVASWRAAYRGIVPDRFLDGLDTGERERSWRQALTDQQGEQLTLCAHIGNELGGWVLEANAGARGFYERLGWTWDGTTRQHPFGDEERPVVRFRRTLATDPRAEPDHHILSS